MEYPFNSIEHITTDTVLSDDDVIKMAKRNIAIVPTTDSRPVISYGRSLR